MSDIKAKLAAAREAKAKRDEEALAKAEAAELALLELEERLTDELGPRGEEFEIVETPDGLVAIKLGDSLLHKRFSNSKCTDEDVFAYVDPCVVHPSTEAFRAMAGKRPAIVVRCASALASLFGAKDAADAKKF